MLLVCQLLLLRFKWRLWCKKKTHGIIQFSSYKNMHGMYNFDVSVEGGNGRSKHLEPISFKSSPAAWSPVPPPAQNPVPPTARNPVPPPPPARNPVPPPPAWNPVPHPAWYPDPPAAWDPDPPAAWYPDPPAWYPDPPAAWYPDPAAWCPDPPARNPIPPPLARSPIPPPAWNPNPSAAWNPVPPAAWWWCPGCNPDPAKTKKIPEHDGIMPQSGCSDTELTAVLNAWYSVGLQTGRYLVEQSHAAKK